ncbi:hypothetical protein TNIN_349651 [Trichonephila inaurata madagascariensis]|uniref:Uncharacterized protein n=1 Tax=Trichonephila inaurata madagascariensis TaxID=2747483 RepID=A0A8X7C5E3_9ARAC|nr:hypothetical protein TNIN_349651 [Trichonephila inaurata madagascariensis]
MVWGASSSNNTSNLGVIPMTLTEYTYARMVLLRFVPSFMISIQVDVAVTAHVLLSVGILHWLSHMRYQAHVGYAGMTYQTSSTPRSIHC